MNLKNNKLIVGMILFFIVIMSVLLVINKSDTDIYFDDFETITSWDIYDYKKDYESQKVSTFNISENSYNGSYALEIKSDDFNDARVYKKIKVEPSSYYKISVMTNATSLEGNGANISAMKCHKYVNTATTNGEWKELVAYIETLEEQEAIELSLGLGGYSNLSKGNVYFDNLKIEKIQKPLDVEIISFERWDEKEDESTVSKEEKVTSVLIFTFAMGFVLIFSTCISVKEKNNPKEEGKLKLDKKDYIILCVLTVIGFIISFYQLGNVQGVSSYWKAGAPGESIVVEFKEPVNINKIAHNGNVPNKTGYYKISYLSTGTTIYKELFTLGEDIEKDTVNKKTKSRFFRWDFDKVYLNSVKSIKIESIVPGWGINELAFLTQNASGEYEVLEFEIISSNTSELAEGSPEALFDEQECVPTVYSHMNSTYFDEIYHARTAYEQLNGWKIYETTHPPLGKIIISIGISIFGMTPFGWRVMGNLFGIAIIPLMYIFALKMFKKKRVAFFAAFLMLFDFMRLVQGRIATIDSFSAFWVIAMYYFMYDYFTSGAEKKPLKPLFLSGLMFGLGAATKWSCIYAGGGLAFIFFLTKFLEFKNKTTKRLKKEWFKKDFLPTCMWCVLFFVIIPITIYILSYIPYMPSKPDMNLVEIALENVKQIFEYHSDLVATHSYESKWYTWPFVVRPVWFCGGADLPEGLRETIASFGHPLIWIISFIAVFVSLFFIWRDKDKNGVLLLVAYAFQYFPWILVTRIAFIYSYLTALPFAILLFAYCMSKIKKKNLIVEIIIWLYMIIVVEWFGLFYPVLTGMVVKESYVEWLRWFPKWYF